MAALAAWDLSHTYTIASVYTCVSALLPHECIMWLMLVLVVVVVLLLLLPLSPNPDD